MRAHTKAILEANKARVESSEYARALAGGHESVPPVATKHEVVEKTYHHNPDPYRIWVVTYTHLGATNTIEVRARYAGAAVHDARRRLNRVIFEVGGRYDIIAIAATDKPCRQDDDTVEVIR